MDVRRGRIASEMARCRLDGATRLVAMTIDPQLVAIQLLMRDRSQIARLCVALEEVADALPQIDPGRCRDAMASLARLPDIHAGCLTLLRALARDDATGHRLAARLAAEYAADEGVAREIAAALEMAAEGGAAADADALGYLLRCFFAGYPRLLLVETLVIRFLRQRRRRSDAISLLDDEEEDANFAGLLFGS